MISVDEAQERIRALGSRTASETLPLAQCNGRILAEDVPANLTQPPFDLSAMDGYAVLAADTHSTAPLQVIGESAAGQRFEGMLEAGQAVRIFTGAPLPQGADAVIIQENVTRSDDAIICNEQAKQGSNIRLRGNDFKEGETILTAGTRLEARALSLAAAANLPSLPVHKSPRVAILSTGDELVPVGTSPGPDQIIASNAIGLAVQFKSWGADVTDLGLLPDDLDAITSAIPAAGAFDLIVTIGGASVGDHDFVQDALKGAGVSLDFWKIAMKPGKPVMAGQHGSTAVIGLPGNPVSALVVSFLFIKPLLAHMQGGTAKHQPRALPLAAPMKANGPRQDHVRAVLNDDGTVAPLPVQDSAHLSGLARADGLIVRPPHADGCIQGDVVMFLPLD